MYRVKVILKALTKIKTLAQSGFYHQVPYNLEKTAMLFQFLFFSNSQKKKKRYQALSTP